MDSDRIGRDAYLGNRCARRCRRRLATFAGVRYAQLPPDPEHRWGYGKAEAVAALMQAVFLAGAALVLIVQSVQRLIRPEPLEEVGFGLWITVLSALAAAGLVAMQS
jgi:divalent metal cation (Fe/Co/Zn/Cd) transporter